MTKGNKIHTDLENPIDNFIIKYFCYPIAKKCNKYNISPNIITFIGFTFALLGCWLLYNFKIYPFIIFFSLAYMCDCLDGVLARKYNKMSKFGDLFDHITDIIQYVGFMIILFKKYNLLKYTKILIFTIFIIFFMIVTQGCQEKIMNQNNNSIILSSFKRLCPLKLEKKMKNLKFLGAGTQQLYSIILAYYLWYQQGK